MTNKPTAELIACSICKSGWVCENHPDKDWNDGNGCCGGAGAPCKECNPSDEVTPPRMPVGYIPIWDIEHGWRH